MTAHSATLPVTSPKLGDAARLAVAGVVALLVWEIFARYLTAWILGGPLEPASLVQSLFRNVVGMPIARLPAEALHYATGILFYPLGYVVVSRIIQPRVPFAREMIWAAMAAFILIMSVDVTTLTSAKPVSVFLGLMVVAGGYLAARFSSSRAFADGLLVGVGTWILALGVFVSLAGIPFMLNWGGLAWMSLVGHVIYGLVVAAVFERLNRA